MRFRQPNGWLSQICEPDGRLNRKANGAMRPKKCLCFICLGLSTDNSSYDQPKPAIRAETSISDRNSRTGLHPYGGRLWPTADSLTQDGHRPCCGRKQTCCYWGRSDLHWGSMAPQNYGELEESAGILSAQRRRVVAELVRGTGIEVDDMPDGSDREEALVEPASSGGSMGCMCCSQAGNTPSVAASMPRRGWSW